MHRQLTRPTLASNQSITGSFFFVASLSLENRFEKCWQAAAQYQNYKSYNTSAPWQALSQSPASGAWQWCGQLVPWRSSSQLQVPASTPRCCLPRIGPPGWFYELKKKRHAGSRSLFERLCTSVAEGRNSAQLKPDSLQAAATVLLPWATKVKTWIF